MRKKEVIRANVKSECYLFLYFGSGFPFTPCDHLNPRERQTRRARPETIRYDRRKREAMNDEDDVIGSLKDFRTVSAREDRLVDILPRFMKNQHFGAGENALRLPRGRVVPFLARFWLGILDVRYV